ncbi:unnamed protein product, partial [Leptidea sinapis]
GRPYGGVALLWRKNLFQQTNIIATNDESSRVVAIKFKINNLLFIAMSVYMPCDCSDNLPEFTSTLGAMSAVVESCDVQMVYMLGDYNAHPDSLSLQQIKSYTEFCESKLKNTELKLDCQNCSSYCLSKTHLSLIISEYNRIINILQQGAIYTYINKKQKKE